ncbi:hypothetical protein BGX29_002773 [Mortierella sp. GBA35]|nr:hypothetical protein BGX29_002773 [Mortierella sp. GBA35]
MPLLWDVTQGYLVSALQCPAYMKRELAKIVVKNGVPATLDELREIVQGLWVNLPRDFIQRLYDGMLKRMKEVIKRRGGNSKY